MTCRHEHKELRGDLGRSQRAQGARQAAQKACESLSWRRDSLTSMATGNTLAAGVRLANNLLSRRARRFLQRGGLRTFM